MRLPQPLYEALPWLYLALGAVALAFWWLSPPGWWVSLLATAGILACVGGLTLVLRRRDYRDQQRRYGRSLDAD